MLQNSIQHIHQQSVVNQPKNFHQKMLFSTIKSAFWLPWYQLGLSFAEKTLSYYQKDKFLED